MLAISRSNQLVAHRPNQLISAYSRHWLIRLFSSAGNNATEANLSDTPRKVPSSRTKEYRQAYYQKRKEALSLSDTTRKLPSSTKKEYNKAYYEKHKEALLLRQKQRDRTEYNKNYCHQHVEQARQNDPSDFREAARAASKQYYQKHKESVKARQKERRAENADAVNEQRRKYYQQNKEASLQDATASKEQQVRAAKYYRNYYHRNKATERTRVKQYKLQNAAVLKEKRRVRYLESPLRAERIAAREARKRLRTVAEAERRRLRDERERPGVRFGEPRKRPSVRDYVTRQRQNVRVMLRTRDGALENVLT